MSRDWPRNIKYFANPDSLSETLKTKIVAQNGTALQFFHSPSDEMFHEVVEMNDPSYAHNYIMSQLSEDNAAVLQKMMIERYGFYSIYEMGPIRKQNSAWLKEFVRDTLAKRSTNAVHNTILNVPNVGTYILKNNLAGEHLATVTKAMKEAGYLE